jgi:hypothetical protein
VTGPSILNQATELVRVDTLHQHPDNPNVGDREAIRESIMEHGLRDCVGAVGDSAHPVRLAPHRRVPRARRRDTTGKPAERVAGELDMFNRMS